MNKTVFEYNTLKFYYMNCGKEYRKKACSMCGSMPVRVG